MKLSLHLVDVIVIIFVLFALVPSAHAETQKRDARMVMGFYYKSITEVATRSDIEVSLNFWVRDLLAEEAEKINIHFTESKAILFDSIKEMHEAMLRGELDIIVAPPLLIAQNFKRNELSDGFTGMLEDKKPDSLLLIAQNDKNIHSIKDLQGKKLLIPSDDEMAEVFLDSLFLKQLSKSYKNIVASVEQQKKASRIVLDIFFKKADAGIVYRHAYDVMVELNPDIANKIVILDQYPVKSRNFSFFVAGYPFSQELSDVVVVSLFNSSPRAQQILSVFKTPVLTRCAVSELEEFDRFYANYMTLKNHARQ